MTEDADEQPYLAKDKLPKLGMLELDDFKLDLDHFLGYDYDDISAASVELPPVIEWINSQLQIRTEQRHIKKIELEEEEAKCFFHLSNGGFEDRGYMGKATATALIMAVKLDDVVKTSKRELAVLDGWCERLHNLLVSLRSKLELVRSSEATRRAAFSSTQN